MNMECHVGRGWRSDLDMSENAFLAIAHQGQIPAIWITEDLSMASKSAWHHMLVKGKMVEIDFYESSDLMGDYSAKVNEVLKVDADTAEIEKADYEANKEYYQIYEKRCRDNDSRSKTMGWIRNSVNIGRVEVIEAAKSYADNGSSLALKKLWVADRRSSKKFNIGTSEKVASYLVAN